MAVFGIPSHCLRIAIFGSGLYNVTKSVALAILMVICKRRRIKIVPQKLRHGFCCIHANFK